MVLQSNTEGGILVRPCASAEDCEAVASLCASAFPEECRGQGLSVQQWSQIEADDLKRTPSWWRQIGAMSGRPEKARNVGISRRRLAGWWAPAPAGRVRSSIFLLQDNCRCLHHRLIQLNNIAVDSMRARLCSQSAVQLIGPPLARPTAGAGLACEGPKLLGVVVLTVENEADDSMSWGEYSRRVGCGPTILSMLYDRVLDEALLVRGSLHPRLRCSLAKTLYLAEPMNESRPGLRQASPKQIIAGYIIRQRALRSEWCARSAGGACLQPRAPQLRHQRHWRCSPVPSALQEHECLIDFIAVSPEARGKGVGAKLMHWAEEAGAAILAETETAAVAARGVEMTLWVGCTLGGLRFAGAARRFRLRKLPTRLGTAAVRLPQTAIRALRV